MHRLRIDAPGIGAGVAAAIEHLAVMHRRHPVQHPAQRLGQGFVCRVHIGEQRVAAAFGQGVDAQDGAHRRLLVARDIRMPILAIGVARIGVGVDDHRLRQAGQRGGGGVDVQFAEAATEGELLLGADVLIAEEDHQMIHQRLMDHIETGIVQRPGQIDATDFSADPRCQLADLDAVRRHVSCPPWRRSPGKTDPSNPPDRWRASRCCA